MAGVVKVYASHAEPSFNLPWQRKRQFASTSSGFAVSIPDENGAPAKRILTNAHSVDYFNQVKCRRRGSDVKHVARVLAIGVECDLALLAVDDSEFWEGIQPVTLSRTLPRLQEKVRIFFFLDFFFVSIINTHIKQNKSFPRIEKQRSKSS